MIGLTRRELALLLKRCSLLFRLAALSIRSITYGLMVSLLFLFAWNYSFFEFVTAGIVWILLYGYYSTNLTSMIYFTNAYIYTLSLIVRIKLKRFSELTSAINWMKVRTMTGVLFEKKADKHKKLASNSTVLENAVSKTRLNFRIKWFCLMNQIIKDLSTYNYFWRHLFTITILW